MLGMGGEVWAGVGSTAASLMFLWAVARQFFPCQFEAYVSKYANKLLHLYYPYMEITFSEYSGERLKRSEAYAAIEAYLAASCSQRAQRLKAELGHGSADLTFSMEDHEEVTDEFRGAKLWWTSQSITSQKPSFSFYNRVPEERRYYRVTFHRGYRQLITDSYLPYVMKEGKAVKVQKRQRKLYTNQSNYDWSEYKKLSWSQVPLEHPATFGTLAMEPDKKEELIQDLLTFSKSKEYYSKVGKPWKRGYLLYGPPGTGKSTLIAAMANLLDYDVYDIELTAVKNNTALKKLLIETTSKSIIVMEDIDCSLDLSGKRKNKHETAASEEEEEKKMAEGGKEDSKVTLSGLLNFIDGLWSSCGGERLIVFTTNYVEKLDPALIRRGRMDVHINLSYCSFGGFKVLARNYLGIESHALFDDIGRLMEEKEITPADVAENLMPKTLRDRDGHQDDDDDIETRLKSLVAALEDCKSKGAGNDDDKISIEESSQHDDKSSQDDKEEAKAGQDGKQGESSA